MAQIKDLLVQGQAKFLRKTYFQDQIVSNVAQGTAPMIVASTTVVSNLNSDYLDGYHASGLFTSLSSNSTNNLSISIGGTTLTTSLYANNAGSVPWTGVTAQMQGGNEFNIPNYEYGNTNFWINYRPRNSRSVNPTLLTDYYLGNLGGGYANITAAGFKKGSSDNSYVLLGGGGHKLESSLSVAYAASAERANYQGRDTFIQSPKGGVFVTSDSTKTGYLRIKLPCTMNNVMLSFFVDIYNYNMNCAVTYKLGGYNYTGGWVYTTAQCVSSYEGSYADLTVRFGTLDNKTAVEIGESNTSWSYPQVVVRDVVFGYSSNATLSNFFDSWVIDFSTTSITVSTYGGDQTHSLHTAVGLKAKYASDADKLDGLHLGDLDYRYARTNWSFASPSDNSMNNSTDLATWVTNMYNQGGYRGYSSITVGAWWWVRSLDLTISSVGTIRTSGGMVIYSGNADSGKNYKHFLVLDAYADLYGITSNEESWKYYSKFLSSRNYTDYTYSKSDADDRFVNVTGDTMTGALTFSYKNDVGLIKNTYGNTVYNLIRNHNNGNISISASTGGIYFGFENTTSHHFYISNSEKMVINSSGDVGIGTSSPSTKLHVNGDSTLGSKSMYYQRSTRGAIHHEFVGGDADYGAVKISHNASEGSGGPGGFTASLGIFDARPDTLSGTYEPTLFVNRTGATRVPDLFGVTVGGNRVFNIDSTGVFKSVLPADPGTGAVTAKILAYATSPYGIVFRGYSSGVHGIQVQRESNNSECFGLALQAAGGNVGIGTTSPENKLDVNGVTSIYPRGNDNTAFKGNLIIKQQNSVEDSGQNFTDSNPSFGIQFNRFWTSGSSPYGETIAAGIYATVSSSWRGGLVFRTKNNQTQGGSPDTNALRLRPDGNAVFNGGIGSKGTNGNVTGSYIAHPGGGVYTTSTSSVTGYLKITLPQKGKNCMMSFDVTIYTYEGTNQSYTTYHISGYEYSTNGWYEPVTKVYSEGIGPYTNLTVRLGNDGTYACVTIGEASTVWSYPQVTVHNIMTGYSGCDVDTWIGGWAVGFTTTALTTVVATRSSVNTQNINVSYATSAGSVTWANITGKPTSKTIWGQTYINASGEPQNVDGICTITANSQTMYLGSQNSSWGHIETTADKFYFNKTIHVNGHVYPYSNAAYDLGGSSNKWRYFYLNNRAYLDEWIQFSTYQGLYWPNNNGAHLYANNVSSYGGLVTQGSRGGYCGLHLGPNTNYLTLMSSDEHQGLYNENKGRWAIYYSRSNNRVGIFDSAVGLGYNVQINGRTGIKVDSYPSLHLYRTDAGETSMYFSNNTAGWAMGINPWGIGAGVFGIGQYSGTGSSTWRFKIDNYGYCYTSSYLNLGAGNEKNASSPPYVLGFNSSDNYIRSYQTAYLSVGYAQNVPYPYSSQAHYGNTSSTAYYKISINSYTSWMLSFIVRVYQGYNSYDIRFSGYNYGSYFWYSPSAQLMGSTASNITVYFGHDSAYHLWVAIPGSSYSGVSVYNAVNGYTQVNMSEKDLFTVSAVSSLDGTIDSTQTIYRPYYSNETVSNVTVNSGNDSNSTYYMVWHSGNTLYSTGGIYCNPYYDYIYASHYYETSDITLKTDLTPLSVSINQISSLPVFDFSWKDKPETRNSGTSAQAVQAVFPNLVTKSNDSLKLDYGVLGTVSSILIAREFVKQQEKIRQLEEEIIKLKEIIKETR